MESTCIGGRIQISNTTYRSLISIAKNRYTVKPRGNIPVKGKGQMYTYWLEGRHGEPKLAPVPDNEFVPSAADALELDASVPPPLDVNVQAAVGLSLEVSIPSASPSAELTRQLSNTGRNAATSPTSPLWSSGGKDGRHLRQQSTGGISQKFTAAALAANAATAEASLEAAFDLMAAKSSRSLARKRDDTEAEGSRLHMDARNQADTEANARQASLEPTTDSVPALSRTRSTGRLRSSKSERIVPKDQKSRTATGANVANVDTTAPNEPQRKPKSSLRRATTRKLSGVAVDVNSGRAKSTANAGQDPIGVQDSEAREQALVAYFDSVNVERSTFHANGALDADEEYDESSYASRIVNDPLSRSITTFVDIDLARFNGAPVVKTSVSRQEPQKPLDGHATLVMNGEVLRRRPDQPLGRNNSFTQQACTVVEQTGRDTALPWLVPEATRTSTHAFAASRRASMAPKLALPWWKTMSFGDRHWQDRATLCLNKPMMKGDAALWERDFQHDMQGRWRNFVRLSVVILIVVLALFTLQDWYKYGGVTPSSIDNPAKVWRDVAIIRYAVLVPILLVFLGCTYMPWFTTRWWFTQVTTGTAMVAIGADLIALSVVGNEPGYGVLALYLVYCVNVSLLALLFRFAILLTLIAAYIGAVLGFYKSSEFRNDAAFGVVYLAIFFFGEMCPVLLREHSIRQNYFRKHRIEVERRKLAEEQLKSTKLLENLLPPVIVKKLRSSKRTLIADTFKEVTILWTDMKGFTNFSANRPPLEVVSFLNAMFSTFDRILDKYGVRKIEVLGDAFFCCAGVPVFTPDHAERCANAALEMQMHMPTLRSFAGADISMRIGVHTGPVIAGVVGLKDPRYHLFGDSVPYANAMESNGEPGMVHISKPTYDLLKSRQEIRARDFVQFVQCQHTQAKKPPQLSDAIRYVSTHGSSSLGRYPEVHMSLLDEYLHQSLGPVEADEHEIIDDATAFIAGVADEPQTARGSGILGVPSSTEITCVAERCDDAVRGQLQLWKNATFLGWDIEVNTVQGALLYTDVPTTQEVAQLPTPTVDNAAASGSVTARAALNIPAFFSKRVPTNASQATEAAAGDEFGPDISRTANGCYWPADPGDFFGPGGGFFAFEERAIDIKGRGAQTTYFLSRADPPFMPVITLELTKLQVELESWAAAQAPSPSSAEPELPAAPRPAGLFPAIGSASEYRMVTGRPSSARPMSGRPPSISVRLTPDSSPRLYPASAPERPHTPKVRSPIAAAKTALASDVVAMQRKRTAAGALPVAATQFIAEVDA
jgi:class 3 adenylate cyclase